VKKSLSALRSEPFSICAQHIIPTCSYCKYIISKRVYYGIINTSSFCYRNTRPTCIQCEGEHKKNFFLIISKFLLKVLSPRAFSAYVLSPRMLITEILSPKALEMRVLSPTFLSFVVLSPGIYVLLIEKALMGLLGK